MEKLFFSKYKLSPAILLSHFLNLYDTEGTAAVPFSSEKKTSSQAISARHAITVSNSGAVGMLLITHGFIMQRVIWLSS